MQGCLICDSPRLKHLSFHPNFGSRIRKCEACSFVQTDFVPDKILRDFYATQYMPEIANFDFEHWNSLRSPQAEAQIGFIGRHAPIDREVRVLDYGAATGELVATFRRHTDHAFALELDPKFKDRLQGIAAGVLDDADFKSERYQSFFDIVTMSHVLEHLWDPYETATAVYKALKPGGWFFVEVPGEARVLEQTGMIGTGHLWFFEADTIRSFFQIHGLFEVGGFRCDGLSVGDYIAGLKQGRQLQPRQDLTDTPDGGSLRLMLRKPLTPREGPARLHRPLNWEDIVENQAEQIGAMYTTMVEYSRHLQAARQEVAALKNARPTTG